MANGNLKSRDDMRASIDVAAIVFAESKETFTAREFTEFLVMGGVNIDEESADDVLGEIVGWGSLREIGPGVYARVPNILNDAPQEHPLWSEDRRP